jgi:hypothetical protein
LSNADLNDNASYLLVDELEKGFSGSKSSGSTDGGTSSRVFGTFLN